MQRNQAGEEQNMRENRKHKATISSLEQQIRLKLDELKLRHKGCVSR